MVEVEVEVELEVELELLDELDEDWKHEGGLDEEQQSLGSEQPAAHHLVTHTGSAGKPPGQSLRTKLQTVCAPSETTAGTEPAQLEPKGLLVKQASAATRPRREMRRRKRRDCIVESME